jgi:hypothetical protein
MRGMVRAIGVVALAIAACSGSGDSDDVVAGGDSSRRVALPVDAAPAGYRLCIGMSSPAGLTTDDTSMIVYGDIEADDPYRHPMVAVVRGGDGSHEGDGTSTTVDVRGTTGAAAPITVFQQVVVDDLGTVVAWEEDGTYMGLYGRGYDSSQTPDLVAFADGLEPDGDRLVLAADALPAAWGVLYDGPLVMLSPFTYGTYSVRYVTGDPTGGMLSLNGVTLSAEAFEALRFFSIGIERDEVDGRQVLAGNAWDPDHGPAAVAWREPDGLTVALFGMNAELDTVQAFAAATRELTDDEWDEVVGGSEDCRLPEP